MKDIFKEYGRFFLFCISRRFKALDNQIEISDAFQKLIDKQTFLYAKLLHSMDEKQRADFGEFYETTRRMDTIRARKYYKKGFSDGVRMIKLLIFRE